MGGGSFLPERLRGFIMTGGVFYSALSLGFMETTRFTLRNKLER